MTFAQDVKSPRRDIEETGNPFGETSVIICLSWTAGTLQILQ